MKTATKQQYLKLAECKRQEAEIAMQEAKLYYELAGVPVQESEVAAKSPQRPTSDEQVNFQPPYIVAPDRKGEFAFYIRGAYEDGMFRKFDGTPATNVEDLGNYVGRCFGVDYSSWRQTLRGAVLPQCALNFFKRILRWARNYKEQVDERRKQ